MEDINIIVGRTEEQRILATKLNSKEAELIALFGRRRVGKTYLVKTLCRDKIVFEFTGIHEASHKEQLQNFSIALQKASTSTIPSMIPRSWIEAFSFLDVYINSLSRDKPAVIFFDEFPWINTPRANFLQSFDHWWNSSVAHQSHLKVIICGSAASWMIDNVVRTTGGLHNRVTQSLRLLPFNLFETSEYLRSRNIHLDHYQLLQLYMAMGGIPHYLKNIEAGESATITIDKLFFTKDGLLKDEFGILYKSLFANSENHESIVRVLARKNKGLSRMEIIQAAGLKSGGTITQVLRELEESGFITPYIPFQKSAKESIYKLSDEYSLFYLKFVENNKASGEGPWLRLSGTPSYTSWSGFAFESVCQKHVGQIKKALGISGVYTEVSGWRFAPTKHSENHGTQVDLLLDRADRCINLCEIKFANDKFVIDKKYATELDSKVKIFRRETKTKKTIFPTMITTYGTRKNEYYTGLVQAEVIMEDLFKLK